MEYAILLTAAREAVGIQQRKAKKMKKTIVIIAVAGLAMAFMLPGCGSSPSSVAKKFANAVIQRDTEAALKRYYTSAMTDEEIKSLKEKLEIVGGAINDNTLKASVYRERIVVAGEKDGYQIVNGKKITKDEANVVIQFVKDKVKRVDGMKIDLLKVDGAWLVRDSGPEFNLDISDK